MGKASRWLMNFLVGKKERDKKREISFYEESVTTPSSASVPSTPTPTLAYKRRWSFGKSSAKKERVHKSSKSLDATINGIPFLPHSSNSLELEYHKRNEKVSKSNQVSRTFVRPSHAADRIRKIVEDAAATRIQAAFRSFLARKALHALRGLVKLQALVRGHLVRKQTTAVLRQMHALMAIQVRARFQRIQMAEDSHLVVKSHSSRYTNYSHENRLRGRNREAIEGYLLRSHSKRHRYLNNARMERVEKETATYYSGDVEFSFPTAQNSPRSPSSNSTTSKIIPGRASFTCQNPDYMYPVNGYLAPHYMANTKSSKAKARSHSEPKQRPVKQKSKRTASMDGRTCQQDAHTECSSSSHSRCISQEHQDPWFMKLYGSTRPKERDFDGNSTTSNYSNYSKLLVTYEPHLNLF